MVLTNKRTRSSQASVKAAANGTNHSAGALADNAAVYNQVSQQPFSYVADSNGHEHGNFIRASNRAEHQRSSHPQDNQSRSNFSSSVSSSGYNSGGANQKYNNTTNNNSANLSSNDANPAPNSHASNGLSLLQQIGRNFRRQPIVPTKMAQVQPMSAPIAPPMVPMMIDDEDDDDNDGGDTHTCINDGQPIDDEDHHNGARSRQYLSAQLMGGCEANLRRQRRAALIDGVSADDDDDEDNADDGATQSRSFTQVRHHHNGRVDSGKKHNLSRSYQHVGDCADSEDASERTSIAYMTSANDRPRYLDYHQQQQQQQLATYAHEHPQNFNRVQVDNGNVIYDQQALAKHHQRGQHLYLAQNGNIESQFVANQHKHYQQYYQPVKHFQVPQQLSYSYHHLAHYNHNNVIPQSHLQPQHQFVAHHPSEGPTSLAFIDNQQQQQQQQHWLADPTGIATARRTVNQSQANSKQLIAAQPQTNQLVVAERATNKMQAGRQHLSSPSPSHTNQQQQQQQQQQQVYSNSSSGISSGGGSGRKGASTPHKSPNRNTYSKKSTSQQKVMAANNHHHHHHHQHHHGGNKASRNDGQPLALGCCGKLAKSILFMINMIFWTSGIALGAWGILALVEDHKYNLSQLLVFEPGSRMSLFQLLSWSFITLGCATILVGFCGCSALFKNNRWILGLYIFLILAIFALDLATGLLAIIFQERLVANVRLRLGNKLRNEYGVQASFTAAIDYIQTRYECCGLEGHFDYDQSLWRLQRLGGFEATVARTCCHLRNTFDDQAHVNPRPVNESMCQSTDVRFHQSYRYRKGCFDELERLIRHKIWTFTTVCGAVGAIIVLSLVFATCFCRSIPSHSSRKSSNSSQDLQRIGSSNHSTEGKKVGSNKDHQRHYR